jgi:hypothetical protein
VSAAIPPFSSAWLVVIREKIRRTVSANLDACRVYLQSGNLAEKEKDVISITRVTLKL